MATALPFATDDPDAYRKQLALALTKAGMDTSPIQSPWQGAARLAQALVGSLYMRGIEQEREKAAAKVLGILPGMGSDTAAPAAGAMPTGQRAGMAIGFGGGQPDYAAAISGIESGGRYDALGPVTKTGDRAYGKYQVMGANIGPWSREVFGQEVTPQQFLSSPEMQDRLFKAKFGAYADKYGPEGAARAWFAGERGMNNPNARDQLGTTVQQYGQRFMQGMQPPGQPAPAVYRPGIGAPAVAQTLPFDGQPMQPQLMGGPQQPPQMPQGGPPMPPNGGVVQMQGPVGNGFPGAVMGQAAGMQPARSSINIPPQVQQTIRQLWSDPRTRPMAMQMYQQYAKPEQFEFKTAGDTLYRTNARQGTAEPITQTGQYRPMTPQEKQAAGIAADYPAFIDRNGKPVFGQPGMNISLSADKKGGELLAQKAIEGYDAANKAAMDANRRIAGYGQMAQAMQGFTPGATADLQLRAKQLLKDVGVIGDAGVSNAEAFKAVGRRLELAATPKGQGQITENERVLIREQLPTMTTSPEGIRLGIQYLRQLDDYDVKVAQIWRDAAKASPNGVPNYYQVQEQIAQLGPPLTDDQIIALRSFGQPQGQAGPAGMGQPQAPRIRRYNPATGNLE